MMRIAILSIALCVIISFSTIAIINGFKENVFDKVSAFSAHITVSSYDNNQSFESIPIDINNLALLDTISDVKSISQYIEKAGIINSNEEIHGVVFKGYNDEDNKSFFEQYVISPGFDFNNRWSDKRNIVVSESLANKLKIKKGDSINAFFIMNAEQAPRARKLIISGIYRTGLEEFDERIIFCNIEQLRRINGWGNNLISGCEINLNDKKNIDRTAGMIHNTVGFNIKAETVATKYPQIFEWLSLQDINAVIIITLIMIISTITIISYLLVIIIEKTSIIGLLKALGANNTSIRRVFINYILITSLIGLAIGNAISFILLWFQKTYRIIKLPEDTYYVNYVPVSINITEIIFTNIGIIIVILLALYIPSAIINKLSPVNAIKKD